MVKKVKHLIIGAGITGLSFANNIKDDYLIIEKQDRVGGYCKTTYKKNFVWDNAGHFFHFSDEYFKKLFIDNVPEDQYLVKEKNTGIYYKGKIIDYPFQTNIHQLEKEEFIECLYDLFNKEEKEVYSNFLDMLYGKFGKSIVEKFLKPYNEKLYACDLEELDQDAMGRFFPYADFKAIINNMKEHKDSSYNNTFLYPKKGAQVIINMFLKNLDSKKILLNTTVNSIDIEKKQVKLSDETIIEFEYLINSMPFDKLLTLLEDKRYFDLSKHLTYNKVLVFNLGFNKKSKYNKTHWLYFPEKNLNFYRVGFYNNILDSENLSMYIEIGYSQDDKINIDDQLERTLENLKSVGIIDDTFELEEYESIVMDPAYIHISDEGLKIVNSITKELNKNNIFSIGRYGAWTYCSMEDCMISAKKLAESIK